VSSEPKDEEAVDETGFLGGRVVLRQPRRGHRAGTDAALVVAAARPYARGRVVDLCAGTGAIGLSLAVLEPGLEVALVEIDPEIAALAAEAAALNGCAGRVRILAADVKLFARQAPSRRRLGAPCDLVVMNPPFTNARASQASPDERRSRAHFAQEDALGHFIDAAAAVLKPKGALVLIHRPDALTVLLEALRPSFGAIALRPVQARAEGAATRILVFARKGSRAPLSIVPPLVLHEHDGSFTPFAEAIHRGEAELGFTPR
jgi:tRNA1(Val) A37 N6-methylase TrmN6